MHHAYSFVNAPAGTARRSPGPSSGHLAAVVVVDDDPRCGGVAAYIQAHLDDPDLGVDALQKAFGVSRPTLYRMFRKAGGVARFIRQRRLAAAYQSLRRRPDMGITWLLYDLGFASERQFQRAFQAEFGLSPSEWRDRCRAAAAQSEPQRRASRPAFDNFAISGLPT